MEREQKEHVPVTDAELESWDELYRGTSAVIVPRLIDEVRWLRERLAEAEAGKKEFILGDDIIRSNDEGA